MSSTPDAFIVAAARTPIGKFLGGLSTLKASELGAAAIREATKRANITGTQVEQGMMGHVVQGAQGQAPARRAPLNACSVRSQQKAATAQAECRFSTEIVTVSIPQRKGDPVVVSKDESVRADTTLEGLAKLGPVTKDKNGVITAGNAPGLNDGG